MYVYVRRTPRQIVVQTDVISIFVDDRIGVRGRLRVRLSRKTSRDYCRTRNRAESVHDTSRVPETRFFSKRLWRADRKTRRIVAADTPERGKTKVSPYTRHANRLGFLSKRLNPTDGAGIRAD